MGWYAITSLDIAGLACKRELLFRDSKSKVCDFLMGRLKSKSGVPEEVWGWYISEADTEETWDFDIDEPRYRATHAVEVPLRMGPGE
jgi:hypothetical protein